jgi:hypothetical protein
MTRHYKTRSRTKTSKQRVNEWMSVTKRECVWEKRREERVEDLLIEFWWERRVPQEGQGIALSPSGATNGVLHPLHWITANRVPHVEHLKQQKTKTTLMRNLLFISHNNISMRWREKKEVVYFMARSPLILKIVRRQRLHSACASTALPTTNSCEGHNNNSLFFSFFHLFLFGCFVCMNIDEVNGLCSKWKTLPKTTGRLTVLQ